MSHSGHKLWPYRNLFQDRTDWPQAIRTGARGTCNHRVGIHLQLGC